MGSKKPSTHNNYVKLDESGASIKSYEYIVAP